METLLVDTSNQTLTPSEPQNPSLYLLPTKCVQERGGGIGRDFGALKRFMSGLERGVFFSFLLSVPFYFIFFRQDWIELALSTRLPV